jgi:hypothetical protein
MESATDVSNALGNVSACPNRHARSVVETPTIISGRTPLSRNKVVRYLAVIVGALGEISNICFPGISQFIFKPGFLLLDSKDSSSSSCTHDGDIVAVEH